MQILHSGTFLHYFIAYKIFMPNLKIHSCRACSTTALSLNNNRHVPTLYSSNKQRVSQYPDNHVQLLRTVAFGSQTGQRRSKTTFTTKTGQQLLPRPQSQILCLQDSSTIICDQVWTCTCPSGTAAVDPKPCLLEAPGDHCMKRGERVKAFCLRMGCWDCFKRCHWLYHKVV